MVRLKMAKKKQIELTIEEKLQNALVPKEEQPYKIPNNWCWIYMYSCSVFERGVTFPASAKKYNYNEALIPCLRTANIQDILDVKDLIYIDKKYLKNNMDKIIRNQDIILSSANSKELVGKTSYIENIKNKMTFGGFNLVIRNLIGNSKYIFYYLRFLFFMGVFRKKASQTTNIANINTKILSKECIPFPPISEQQRIVNRIESLFAKLDRAKELIENTLAQWEQNKMAILHKAFTGELTAKWRKENNIDLSSWENGILMDFCKINPKKINTKEFDDDMIVSFIPMPCVSDIWGKIVKKELRKLGEVKKGYTNFCEGDVLFAKITPCMENGKSAIVDKLENDIGFGSTEFYVLRCDENKLNNKYLHYFVRQKTFRDEAKGEMTGAVGQQRVPKTFLENYKMKVPTIEEQQEIVNILDKLLAKYNKIKNLKQQLEKIELLKKAILAKAFRGELGTNNPDEESAENLLKEILAEK